MHKLIFHTEANTVEKEIHIHTHTKSLGYKSPDLQWLKVIKQSPLILFSLMLLTLDIHNTLYVSYLFFKSDLFLYI